MTAATQAHESIMRQHPTMRALYNGKNSTECPLENDTTKKLHGGGPNRIAAPESVVRVLAEELHKATPNTTPSLSRQTSRESSPGEEIGTTTTIAPLSTPQDQLHIHNIVKNIFANVIRENTKSTPTALDEGPSAFEAEKWTSCLTQQEDPNPSISALSRILLKHLHSQAKTNTESTLEPPLTADFLGAHKDPKKKQEDFIKKLNELVKKLNELDIPDKSAIEPIKDLAQDLFLRLNYQSGINSYFRKNPGSPQDILTRYENFFEELTKADSPTNETFPKLCKDVWALFSENQHTVPWAGLENQIAENTAHSVTDPRKALKPFLQFAMQANLSKNKNSKYLNENFASFIRMQITEKTHGKASILEEIINGPAWKVDYQRLQDDCAQRLCQVNNDGSKTKPSPENIAEEIKRTITYQFAEIQKSLMLVLLATPPKHRGDTWRTAHKYATKLGLRDFIEHIDKQIKTAEQPKDTNKEKQKPLTDLNEHLKTLQTTFLELVEQTEPLATSIKNHLGIKLEVSQPPRGADAPPEKTGPKKKLSKIARAFGLATYFNEQQKKPFLAQLYDANNQPLTNVVPKFFASLETVKGIHPLEAWRKGLHQKTPEGILSTLGTLGATVGKLAVNGFSFLLGTATAAGAIGACALIAAGDLTWYILDRIWGFLNSKPDRFTKHPAESLQDFVPVMVQHWKKAFNKTALFIQGLSYVNKNIWTCTKYTVPLYLETNEENSEQIKPEEVIKFLAQAKLYKEAVCIGENLQKKLKAYVENLEKSLPGTLMQSDRMTSVYLHNPSKEFKLDGDCYRNNIQRLYKIEGADNQELKESLINAAAFLQAMLDNKLVDFEKQDLGITGKSREETRDNQSKLEIRIEQLKMHAHVLAGGVCLVQKPEPTPESEPAPVIALPASEVGADAQRAPESITPNSSASTTFTTTSSSNNSSGSGTAAQSSNAADNHATTTPQALERMSAATALSQSPFASEGQGAIAAVVNPSSTPSTPTFTAGNTKETNRSGRVTKMSLKLWKIRNGRAKY